MVAKTVVAPLDRTKILFQVTHEPYRVSKVPTLLMSIARTSGIHALWKGNGAQLMRVFPYSGIQFMVFDFLKNVAIKKRQQQQGYDYHQHNNSSINNKNSSVSNNSTHISTQITTIESMVFGAIAAVISTVCTYPLDLARTKLAVTALDDLHPSSSKTTATTTTTTKHHWGVRMHPTHWKITSVFRHFIQEFVS